MFQKHKKIYATSIRNPYKNKNALHIVYLRFIDVFFFY